MLSKGETAASATPALLHCFDHLDEIGVINLDFRLTAAGCRHQRVLFCTHDASQVPEVSICACRVKTQLPKKSILQRSLVIGYVRAYTSTAERYISSFTAPMV